MRLLPLCLFLSILMLSVAACASEPEPEPAPVPEPQAEIGSSGSSDAVSNPGGTWAGDWGPSERDRNPVTLELQWDGSALSGTINPGSNPVPLTNTSYDPATGAISMEADVQGRGGSPVHYTIQGMVSGNMMTGTWSHDDRQGDFSVTKQ